MSLKATVLLFLLACATDASAQGQTPTPNVPTETGSDRLTANFGDLAVTATNIFVEVPGNATDSVKVTGFVTFENVGEGVVCASVIALLRTSNGLEYIGVPIPPTEIYEMFPHQSADGSYLFDAKAGDRPLQLIFELQGGTIRCKTSKQSLPKDASISKEIRLDVHDLPGLTAHLDEPTFQPGIGGVTYPRCIHCPDPRYTSQARHTRLEGTVHLQAVVGSDGMARDIEIVQGLGPGLDEEAVKAIRTWRFKPALGPNGDPVATIVPIEITFRVSHEDPATSK